MANRKEVFLVFLVLLLFLIRNVAAIEEASPYAEIYISFEDKWGCNDDNDNIDEIRLTYTQCEPLELGCTLHSYNSDGSNQCAGIVPGLIIKNYYQPNLFCGDGDNNKYENALYPGKYQSCPDTFRYNDYFCPHTIAGKLTKSLASHDIKTQDGSQYLCSDNHYWKQCSEENENKIAWANNILYKCVINEDSGSLEWITTKSEDSDHDGYTTDNGDCDDNPEDDPDPESCPTSLTEQECDSIQHSACAICINPGRPEVCGDGINNDCGGPQAPQSGYNDPTAIQLGPTPDNCHTFREGCEQKTFIETGHPADVASTDEDTPDFANNHHTNIYGKPFSWIDLKDGTGYCCGMGENGDGLKAIDDLGKVGEAVDGDYLCLNKNFVGSAPERIDEIYWGPKQSEGDSAPSAETGCKGEWCWIPAAGEPAFHVLTVKPPGQQPYDVVSNSEKWFPCAADAPPTLELPQYEGTDGTSFLEVANRFYCYQEGEHGSWADCVEGEPRPLADADVNGVKTRLVGDGLFALPVTSSTATSVAVDFDKLKNFYDDSSLDIVNYDTLEFYVKFTKDIIPPADVTLIIRGPTRDGKPLEYFHQKVLGYAIGNPVLEKDRWIHVQVPLPASGWYGVSSIELQSEPADNEIIVRNIYLSKAGKTQFCSGEKSDREGQSAWLDGLDFYGN